MAVEEALEKLGGCGRYQILTFVICCLAFYIPGTWQLFSIVFIGYINPHHCKVPPNGTLEEWLPLEEGPDGRTRYSQCTMYQNRSWSNSTTECMYGYEYQADGFDLNGGTITIEWDLVCDKDAYVELSQTIFNIGGVIGFFVFSPLGDRFGRKKIFFLGQLLLAVFGVILSFSPDFISFCILQGITGAAATGIYMTGLVLACEMFTVRMRTTMAPLSVIFAAVALAALPLCAVFLRHWRKLQLSVSIIAALFLIYYKWCPESLRWLEANRRFDEIKKQLSIAAKYSGVDLPDNVLGEQHDDEKNTEEQNASFLTYLKSPRPRRYIFLMTYIMFVNNIMFFGLSLMMGALSGNAYLNVFLNAIVDIPAVMIAVFAMHWSGRRWPLAAFHLQSGVFMGIAGAMSAVRGDGFENNTWVLAFALIARLGIGGAYAIEMIYAQEIFPTNLRTTGLGVTVGAGFFGSILSPYSVYLFRLVNWLPCTIFAVLSIIGSFVTLLLPETVGRKLPLTVEEVASWSLTLSDEEKRILRKQRLFCGGQNAVAAEEQDSCQAESSQSVFVVGSNSHETGTYIVNAPVIDHSTHL